MAAKEEKMEMGLRIVGTKELVQILDESVQYNKTRRSKGEAARNYSKGSYIADVLIDVYSKTDHVEGVVKKKFWTAVEIGTKENKSILTFNLPESIFKKLTLDADQSTRTFSGQVRFVMGLHLDTLTKSRSKK